MLELNISFIFHLLCIAIGCRTISLFLDKLYDNLVEYKEKEIITDNFFNNENKILKEKTIYLEEKFNSNIKEIQITINKFIIKNRYESLKKFKNSTIKNPISKISETKKLLIDNYFALILKKID
jgi:hypothetical protein